MNLALTPHMLAAAYEYLRACQPFSRWKLPHADAVEFHVTRHRDRYADHECRRADHIIRVSSYSTGTSDVLIQTMAHEMLHVRQQGAGLGWGHNKWFKRASQRVCRIHGWQPGEFIG